MEGNLLEGWRRVKAILCDLDSKLATKKVLLCKGKYNKINLMKT